MQNYKFLFNIFKNKHTRPIIKFKILHLMYNFCRGKDIFQILYLKNDYNKTNYEIKELGIIALRYIHNEAIVYKIVIFQTSGFFYYFDRIEFFIVEWLLLLIVLIAEYFIDERLDAFT